MIIILKRLHDKIQTIIISEITIDSANSQKMPSFEYSSVYSMVHLTHLHSSPSYSILLHKMIRSIVST